MALLVIIILGIVIYYIYKSQKKKEQHIKEIRNLQQDIKEDKKVDKIVQKYNHYWQTLADKEKHLQDIGYSPLPADVQNNRKLYRKLYREAKKSADETKMKEQLNNLYKLGVLYTLSYGNRDCTNGVIGYQNDRAVNWLTENYRIIDKYTYQEHGIIHDCGMLSETDWKHFISSFGLINKNFYLLNEIIDSPGNHMEDAAPDFAETLSNFNQ